MSLSYNTIDLIGEERLRAVVDTWRPQRRRRKDDDMLDTIKDKTGVYKLGFNKYSFLGIVLPLAFVLIVGGGLAALVILN